MEPENEKISQKNEEENKRKDYREQNSCDEEFAIKEQSNCKKETGKKEQTNCKEEAEKKVQRKNRESDLEKALLMYKERNRSEAREEKILETIRKSKELFFLKEQQHPVSYFEFMFAQFHFIRKRWWVLQTFMLAIVSFLLPDIKDEVSLLRILSVIGVLFVVFMIPEFFRNKHYDCIQVEGTCLYSLRQIYSARMIWFGMMDMLLLICFCAVLRGNSCFAAEELMVQFLFPMLVAACICFGLLGSHTRSNEAAAIMSCFLWNAIWCFLIVNETVYQAITFPVWCVLFAFFLMLLAGAVYRTMHACNDVRAESTGP